VEGVGDQLVEFFSGDEAGSVGQFAWRVAEAEQAG
jgi:hypothetical protein